MADITSEQIDELVKQLGKSAGALKSIADKSGARSAGGGVSKGAIDATSESKKSSKEETKEFNRKVSSSAESLRSLTKGTDGFTKSIANFSSQFAGGFIIAEIAKYAGENIKVYKDLSNVGETFGGSMLGLSKAAADAGLPLELYGKLIKNNSIIVKQLGVAGFGKLQKDVRKMSDQYGNYGMSLDQMDEMTLRYAETMRLSGRSAKSLVNIGPEINSFASNMTAISGITGKNREEIEKQALEIMNDPLFRAKSSDNMKAGLEGYNKALQDAITELSGQADGGQLAKALGEASSNIGGVNFTQFGQMVNDLGQSGISEMIQEANDRLQRGDDASQVSSDLVRKVKEQLSNPEVKESLELQASMGNENAKKMLEMGQSLKTYTKAEIDRQKATQKTTATFTAFMESFSSTMGELTGSLLNGFLAPFLDSTGKVNDTFFKTLRDMQPDLEKLGRAFGEIFSGIIKVLPILLDFSLIVLPIVGKAFGFLASTIKLATDGINMLSKFIGGWFGSDSKLGKGVSDVTKAILSAGLAWLGFTAYLKGKEFLATLFGKGRETAMMNVKAGIVNIDGAFGGGAGGGKGGEGFAEGKGIDAAKKLSREEKFLEKAYRKNWEKGLRGKELDDALRAANAARKEGLIYKSGQALSKISKPVIGFGETMLEHGRGALRATDRMAGGALGKITEHGGKLISKASGPIMEGLGKVAKYGSKLAAIPVAGALMAGGLSGFNEFGKSGNLIKSLFVGAGAAGGGLVGEAGGAFVGSAAGPVGTVAGEIAGGIGGATLGENAASMLYDTLFGKVKPKANPADKSNTEKPKEINDEDLQRTRFLAEGGDEKSIKALEKLQEAIDKQTMIVNKGNKADQRNSRALIEQFSYGAAR